VKKEVTIKQAKGMKFLGIVFSQVTEQLVLNFENAFTTLGIEKDPWSPGDIDGFCQSKLNPAEFGRDLLSGEGVISEEEIIKLRIQRDLETVKQLKQAQILRENAERTTYEMLKKKYGGAP
jgi:hypothetical protein